jgi:hypothetical protein
MRFINPVGSSVRLGWCIPGPSFPFEVAFCTLHEPGHWELGSIDIPKARRLLRGQNAMALNPASPGLEKRSPWSFGSKLRLFGSLRHIFRGEKQRI